MQNVLGYSTFDAGFAILPAGRSWCWSRRLRPGLCTPTFLVHDTRRCMVILLS
jgi:hypothetical protein